MTDERLKKVFKTFIMAKLKGAQKGGAHRVYGWFVDAYQQKAVKSAKPKMAEETPFKNAIRVARKNPNLRYAEGFILRGGSPDRHAWNEVKSDGRPWVDYTLPQNKTVSYFGAVLPMDLVLAVVRHPAWKESSGSVMETLSALDDKEADKILVEVVRHRRGISSIYCKPSWHRKLAEVCRKTCASCENYEAYVGSAFHLNNEKRAERTAA